MSGVLSGAAGAKCLPYFDDQVNRAIGREIGLSGGEFRVLGRLMVWSACFRDHHSQKDWVTKANFSPTPHLFNSGFVLRGKTVASWNGKDWKQTGHNLDRIYERDRIADGVEIKNTLKYI
jgi:hypothetical protein